jgi:carbon storage regulator CsrA
VLVLSRKVGQHLVIGGGIVVVVKRIAGHRVTLGIEAPGTVKIIRGELPVFGEIDGDAHDEAHHEAEIVIETSKPR